MNEEFINPVDQKTFVHTLSCENITEVKGNKSHKIKQLNYLKEVTMVRGSIFHIVIEKDNEYHA